MALFIFLGGAGGLIGELHKGLALMIPQIIPTACVLLKVCLDSLHMSPLLFYFSKSDLLHLFGKLIA